MEMILTGNRITAQEALQYGLISHVYQNDQLEEKAIEMADKIASHSKPVIAIAKETVNMANNVGLDQGVK